MARGAAGCVVRRVTPEADLVIEYTRPEYHGEPLLEDVAYLRLLSRKG